MFQIKRIINKKEKSELSVYVLNSSNQIHYKELLKYKQRPNVVSMISNIITFEKRNQLIAEKLLELTKD